MGLPLFGYPTRLLAVHFGHKVLAIWNVGVTVIDIQPPGNATVSVKSSTGLPPPPLSNAQLAAILKNNKVNTTILGQQTPASVTFQVHDLALPPDNTVTATAEVQALPPDPAGIPGLTDSSIAYLHSLQPKITGATGLTFQFLGVGNGYTTPTEAFTIPLWVSVLNKKFA